LYLLWGGVLSKNQPKTRMVLLFFAFESSLRQSKNGKNVKITHTVAILVTKHPAKFESKKL